ncbi:hypothetical protein [Haladaptatus sp. NG-WS-4]
MSQPPPIATATPSQRYASPAGPATIPVRTVPKPIRSHGAGDPRNTNSTSSTSKTSSAKKTARVLTRIRLDRSGRSGRSNSGTVRRIRLGNETGGMRIGGSVNPSPESSSLSAMVDVRFRA